MSSRVGLAFALLSGLAVGWFARPALAPPPVPVALDRPAGPKASSASLFYLHTDELRKYYPAGKLAGSWMASTVSTGDPSGCRKAQEIWASVAATENFGGEYGALDWLCTWLTSPVDTRGEMTRESVEGRRLVQYFEEEGWVYLEKYLQQRYELAGPSGGGGAPPAPPTAIAGGPGTPPVPRGPHTANVTLDYQQLLFLHELLRFGGPQRAAWEHTDALLTALRIEPGMEVVDLGAGNGFFSFRVAPMVGEEGTVYALEIDRSLLAFIERVKSREALYTIQTVENTLTSLTLPPDSADMIWACNLYLNFYGGLREADRKTLMDDIHRTLRPGGRLVISDNTPEGELSPGTLYYHGFAISPSLIVDQLEGYGFQLVARHDLLEQRFVLEFVEI